MSNINNKKTSSITLTDKEKQLIADFRSMSIQGQEYILEAMGMAKIFFRSNIVWIDKFHRNK